MTRFNYDSVPTELKKLQRWVLWQLKKIDNKTTKIPINAKNGYGAKSNDASTWVTFDEAKKKVGYLGCDGLGFMLGNGYVGIDIDHEIENEALIDKFVDKLKSYTEISQSGKGIHIICKGFLPVGNRRKGNIEMYDNARFFALTGNLYKKSYEIKEDRSEELKELWQEYLADEKPINDGAYVYRKETKNATSTLNDQEIIEKAQESQTGNLFTCLYYGQWQGLYPSQSEADMAFCSMLAFWCAKDKAQMDRIFRNSKLYRTKWDEMRGSDTYGEITLNSAINNCRDTYTPAFSPQNQVYNPATGKVDTNIRYDLNDTGNAYRFIDRFGESIKYNFDRKFWMIWDGKTWVQDIKQIVKTKADILIDEMKIEAAKEPDKDYQKELFKNIKHVSSNSGKEAMLKEAMHIGSIPTNNCDYDKEMYKINCFNGIVDLKTGKIEEHRKEYMFSKNTQIVCDMDSEPKRWIQFLGEIFKGNNEMVEYVQRAIGYTLTGDTREQCFFQCYGDGANGKSVFLDIVYKMLGDYALNSQVESILARNNSNNSANSEIARMNGARFVRTNEPNEGSRFNEGLVKQLVSGDVTTARFLYGTEFEFNPEFKLWIATNYKIQVRGTDYGIWRRMRLVPFEVKFEGDKADKALTEKLMRELPQILGWAVKGAIKWAQDGLHTPQEIEWANKQYKQEMDIVASFISDCTKEKETGREKASDVYKEYSQWAKDGHEFCMTQSKFGIEMGKRFAKKNINGYVYYLGFILKRHDDSYVYTKE